jgi:hypothetical protein
MLAIGDHGDDMCLSRSKSEDKMGFEVVSSRYVFRVFPERSFSIPYDADNRNLGWQEKGSPE